MEQRTEEHASRLAEMGDLASKIHRLVDRLRNRRLEPGLTNATAVPPAVSETRDALEFWAKWAVECHPADRLEWCVMLMYATYSRGPILEWIRLQGVEDDPVCAQVAVSIEIVVEAALRTMPLAARPNGIEGKDMRDLSNAAASLAGSLGNLVQKTLENYQDARWFSKNTSIPPERLRKAAERGDIRVLRSGKRVLYSVPMAQTLWPADYEGNRGSTRKA